MIVGGPVGAFREVTAEGWAEPPRGLISIVGTMIVGGPIRALWELGLTDCHNGSYGRAVVSKIDDFLENFQVAFDTNSIQSKDHSSSRLNALGSLCLWQCLLKDICMHAW